MSSDRLLAETPATASPLGRETRSRVAPHLSTAQRAGLRKVGDVLIPGDGELPSFSASGCVAEVDRVLDHMSERDRNAVRMLFGVFRFVPRLALRIILALTDRHRLAPEPIATALRLISIGVKGVVMTLYYSDVAPGASIHRQIGWDATVVEPGGADIDAAPTTSAAEPNAESAIRSPVPVHGRKQAAQVEVTPGTITAPAHRSRAAEAAKRARNGTLSLSRLPVAERARYLEILKNIILKRREGIVDRIQAETGKCRSDALVSEIFGTLDNLAWLTKRGTRALKDRKQHTPLALMGKTSWTWYEPLGVVLIISPWNYPFYQAVVPIAAAVLAGNAVLYKPSEWTPLEGLVESLLSDAGFAPNWVQVVYGDGKVGAELIEHRPDKIFFTGSTRTGQSILAQAAAHLIPVDLELGGKDAMIVFEDVNLERAAAGAAWGALTTSGQSCTAVERLYVQDSIYEPFKSALLREVERLKQEIDTDGDADVGAMTTGFQVEIVARQVADARARGAVFLTGGDWNGTSRMIPPMVVDRVTEDMLLAREETFGPIIPLFSFKTENEVIRRANDSVYGLTASVWTSDVERAKRVGRALAVGGVSINNVMATEANPALPFGGVKQSGFGRYKGEHGLHGFCNVKSVLIDKDSAKIEANWYPYTSEKYRLFTDLTVGLFAGGWRSLVKFALAGLKLERYATRASKEGRR